MAVLKKPKDPKEVYNPTGKELELLRFVVRRKQEMGDARAKFEPLWDRWEKAWEAYRPPKAADDWQSDIYIPITTATIEAVDTNQSFVVLSSRKYPFIKFAPLKQISPLLFLSGLSMRI